MDIQTEGDLPGPSLWALSEEDKRTDNKHIPHALLRSVQQGPPSKTSAIHAKR
jgi:hypothetical protein